jgi:hypothetical protein
MASLDVAILISWSSWILFPIAHRHPWGHYTSRQHYWYKELMKKYEIGIPAPFYGIYWLIVFPLLILTLWAYTRTYESQKVYYIITLLFSFLAVGVEKVATELFWDRQDFGAAFYTNLLLVLPFYLTSTIACGITPNDNMINDHWIKWLLMTMLIIQTLWTLLQIYISFNLPFVSRDYARNRRDIK